MGSEHASPVLPTAIPYAVFNQNAYLTFSNFPFPDEHGGPAKALYSSPEYLGTAYVSEDNRAYLEMILGATPLHRVRYGVDVAGARGSVPKAGPPRVAFMPRKNSDHSKQVLNILSLRGALDGWIIRNLDGLSHREVLVALDECSVFMSFGYPEGFGLPLLEAMAAGCLVVGYHGEGGSEVLDETTGLPVSFGDIRAFVVQAERALDLTIDNRHVDLVQCAYDRVARDYSLEAERRSVIDTWTKFAAMHAELSGGATSTDGSQDALRRAEAGTRQVEHDAAALRETVNLLSAEVASLQANLDLACHQRDTAQAELAQVYKSSSWRLTAAARSLRARRRK